ncbi:MAG: Gfo/Idh/MocA family oxidoreductase [Ginsengibacter sp.]|jgi:UDP-N-acetyl-2-amino-2-deoxyglucuronate dehydrogenase
MKNFALIGAGGYIAPRHMKAIMETENQLIAALDKNDSVGILDNYFPDAEFFTEFERFDRHIEKLKRKGIKTDYVSVCSPNYLHDAHIRFGLRIGATVICEKPIVLNPWNVDALLDIEKETGNKVFTILQLRMHPAIIALKKKVETQSSTLKHKINLTYIAARGNWYQSSWKGDVSKSGGISTNLGIHFFDMLIWIFGDVVTSSVTQNDVFSASGELELEKAFVTWSLSTDVHQLPSAIIEAGQRTFRNLQIDGENFDFSNGLENLHTACYEAILNGKGFSLSETKPSIVLAHQIRNAMY